MNFAERSQRDSHADATTIVDVRARALQVAVEEPVKLSFGTLEHRSVVLVEIELANGVIGYGESWVNWPVWAAFERLAAYEHGLRPRLVGCDAHGITRLHEMLTAELGRAAQQAGAPGPLVQAISGVELALWDALGKVEGIAVAELKGRCRESIPVYASSVGPASNLERNCEQVAEAGFLAVKVRVGFGRETDRDVLGRVRRSVGEKFEIIADANRAWTLEEAVQAGRMLADHGIQMVEEPCQRNDRRSIERLHSETGLRVTLGENVYDDSEYRVLMGSEGLGAIQPDLTKNGGFSFAHHVGQMAESSGTALMPHCYGGPLGFLASLQLMATMDLPGSVEYPVGPSAPFWNMIGSQPPVSDGTVSTPTGAGFGFHPNQDWLSTVTVARSPSGSGPTRKQSLRTSLS